jgi:dihydroneopterin aldolase
MEAGRMDRISLRNIRVLGRHGNDPGERDRPAPFDVDVVLEIDASRAQRSDDLADTLDYALLHRQLVQIVAGTSFALLERLAAELADAVMGDRRVRRAEVTVAKPGILDGATPAVTVVRERVQ